MALKKEQKQAIIKDFEDKIGRAKAIVFTKFFGVKANDINGLRRMFKAQNSEYVVTKKTLMERAFAQSAITGVQTDDLAGEVATVFGYEDEVAPAKIMSDFIKTHQNVEVLGGVLEGKFIPAQQVRALASLPSKLELYAKVVGSLQAPLSGLVRVLAGNLTGLVRVLKAIEAKK